MNQQLIMPKDCLIVLMYEGSAEKAILEYLLDNELLIFTWDDLFENKIFQRCALTRFCKCNLNHEMNSKIQFVRVIDSKNEKFNIPPAYKRKIYPNCISIITTPEIEKLHIIAKDKMKEFEKSGFKPSQYCSKNLKLKKNYSAHVKFWENENLVKSIKEYNRISNNDEFDLSDLLKV